MESVLLLEHILDGREKPTNLPFALLKDITKNFSEDREIGQGGFATVYKGVLPNGLVAVKRIKSSHSINPKLFYRELDSLLTINHENVVRFLGFCASTNETAIKIDGAKGHIYAEVRERLFCLEYISNGSLQKHITDELRGLEWDTRYRIVTGICEGLHHLHKENQIYHMDLKPANILLDSRMVPKITDFGLSRLDEKSETMSEDRLGSLGYCAPEYLRSGKMSFKSDMYSLGVIITELVTGEKGIPDDNKNNVLRRWRHRWKKSGKETPLVYQQVAKCMEIGLLCQEIDPVKRPFIWDLIHDIREMDSLNGTISNDCEYTFGQISPYSEDDMLGVEPLELYFQFELNKQMSCSLQLTNETDSYIAFNIQNMSPLPYCMQPNKDILPPRSKCSVEVTLHPQDKAPRDMQRVDELVVWSTKVDGGLAAKDITINMYSNESAMVDAMNLDVVFGAEECTKVSKEHIPCSITEDMSNNEIDGTVGDAKKSQEYLLPTAFRMSSKQNHQQTTKESSETQQTSDKTSEMVAHEEDLRMDMLCAAIASKDHVPGEMFINKTDRVADAAKSAESLSATWTVSGSSIGNQNYQEGAQAFSEPQSARDTTTKTKVISVAHNVGDSIIAMDVNQKEPLIITGHSGRYVHVWNYDTKKLMFSGYFPEGSAALSVKFIEREGWSLVGSDSGFIHVYNYKNEMQKITSIKAQGGHASAYPLAIHPTQPYVLAGCDMAIKLWDWDRGWFGWKCLKTFKEHKLLVCTVAFNPKDHNSFASASCDGTIKVWSLDSSKSKYTLSGHSSQVQSLDFFTRDGQQYLITGSVDKTAKIWDMQKKQCVHTLPHRSGVCSVLPHPRLPLLVTGTEDGTVYFWSSTNFRPSGEFNMDGRSGVKGLTCLMGSGRVVVAHKEGVSVVEIGDEGQGSSNGNDENSISATD